MNDENMVGIYVFLESSLWSTENTEPHLMTKICYKLTNSNGEIVWLIWATVAVTVIIEKKLIKNQTKQICASF